MTDQPPGPAAPPPAPKKADAPPVTPVPAESPNAQLIVALSIVASLGATGIGLIVAGCLTGQWAVLSGGIGTIIGALATALNAPTGIANVLRSAKGPAP